MPDALKHYETVRREEVEKTQHAADVSLVWFEKPQRFWKLEPMQLAFSLLSRSKQITYENLKRRDPNFGAEVDRWWAGRVRNDLGVDIPTNNPPPPMFTPFRVGNMWVKNRVVVSPMNMYSAEPGNIAGDFHLVHLGQLAMGGAGLVFAEMTVGERGCAHHAGLSRHLYAGAGRGLEAHLRFRPQATARRNSACSLAMPAARARPGSAGKAWTCRCRTAIGRWFRPRR